MTNDCSASGADVVNVSVLYGLICKRRYGYISGSIGLGMVRANPPTVTISNFTVSNPARYTVIFRYKFRLFGLHRSILALD